MLNAPSLQASSGLNLQLTKLPPFLQDAEWTIAAGPLWTESTIDSLPPSLQVSERTTTAGLLWVEPTEAGRGGFSSREDEGVSQRHQTSNRPIGVCRGERVCRHESVAIAAQHQIPGLQATSLFTTIQHLRENRREEGWSLHHHSTCQVSM